MPVVRGLLYRGGAFGVGDLVFLARIGPRSASSKTKVLRHFAVYRYVPL
jgi:hypothetical protein